MNEKLQLLLVIVGLLCAIWISRKVTMWRIIRAYRKIIHDLKNAGATDPSSAVSLSYSKESIFRAGMKDYRRKALEYLVSNNVVGMTDENKYYLKEDIKFEGSLWQKLWI
ncbi:MAG TPA: hypothetical protein ENG73_07075 [Desulfobacterales bacterium]|nr:hypothetical protein [Desulfobacterales bacterium]